MLDALSILPRVGRCTWPHAVTVHVLLCVALLVYPQIASPRPMLEDPKGFKGIPWGASLQEFQHLTHINTWRIVDEYEFRDGPPRWGDATLKSVKLSAVYGKFARVSIHYQGEDTHQQLVAYLESRFGKIDLMPGSMVRGLNQLFNWRGPETEINLTYQGFGERGWIYVESRVYAAGFTDMLPENAY